ncbi:hypothetical protein [Streptosporangium amethystogenes]|uniref:hypothetical protein n=1 Tax=Streptosporangium amethystogenes TaxID=2002 RepID=UPI0012F8BA1C|nr:hypothetical protein [Streptosporangium amethystogenes]
MADLQARRPLLGEGGQGLGRRRARARRTASPSAEPPPAWEHRIWSDSAAAAVLGCRYCLGSKTVAHLDESIRTLVMTPCRCQMPEDPSTSA